MYLVLSVICLGFGGLSTARENDPAYLVGWVILSVLFSRWWKVDSQKAKREED